MAKDPTSYRGYKDLKVYQLSYQLALEIQELTARFPREERYSLIDQIRRSSRSVPANLAEAWKKRRYEKAFISKIIDCAGEAGETEVWLDFSKDVGYLESAKHKELITDFRGIEPVKAFHLPLSSTNKKTM